MANLTKNQHYVWQHYLRGWASPGQLWCLRSDQTEPFPTSARNVGSERFFYEFHELSLEDLAFLEHLISQAADPGLREVNQGWIRSFQASFRIRRQLAAESIDAELRNELEVELRLIERTIGETFHSATETRAIPILNALRQGDASFCDDLNTCMDFIHFITFQYFRTARMRNAVTAINLPLPHNQERTWPVEAFIYATNVGAGLFSQRGQYRIILLHNRSSVPLIAGDQPVINLNGAEAKDILFYYPLTPDLAMMYTADPGLYPAGQGQLGKLEVEYYNFRIYQKSDSQIYGNDPDYLKALSSLPKYDPLA